MNQSAAQPEGCADRTDGNADESYGWTGEEISCGGSEAIGIVQFAVHALAEAYLREEISERLAELIRGSLINQSPISSS